MKKTIKKTITGLLVMALVLGVAQPSQAAAPKLKREKLTKNNPDPVAYFSYPYSGAREWVYLGKTLRAAIVLPTGAKVKSVSLSSSNKKVIKIVNKKKSLIKAVKPGRSKLTLKVVWTYSGRLKHPNYKFTGQNDDFKSVKKSPGKLMQPEPVKQYMCTVTREKKLSALDVSNNPDFSKKVFPGRIPQGCVLFLLRSNLWAISQEKIKLYKYAENPLGKLLKFHLTSVFFVCSRQRKNITKFVQYYPQK